MNQQTRARWPGWGPAALLAAVLAWAALLAGLLPGLEIVLGFAIAQTAAYALTFVAFRAARRGTSALGRGAWALFAGAALWSVVGTVWFVARLAGLQITWHNYAYPLVALCLALAARSAVAGEPRAGGPVGAARLAVDTVLVALSAGIVWWLAISGLPRESESSFLVATLLAADSIFVVTALMAWTRSRPETLLATGLMAAASILLLVADLLFATVHPIAAYAGGTAIDLIWFLFLVLLILVATAGRTGGSVGVGRRTASWAQAMMPPAVALLTLVVLEVLDRTHWSAPLDVGIVALLVALIVRHVLHFAESHSLSERLSVSGRKLTWQADHDLLTGLLGRAAFVRDATRMLTDQRADGTTTGILWIDLDAFKRVNDSLGHKVGDDVLRTVADRLQLHTAETDLVARLGGDEFAVLRPRMEEAGTEFAERIRAALAAPVVADGLPLSLTCSIGLVEATADDGDVAQLLIDSDLALYQAKRAGRNRVEPYSSVLRVSQAERTGQAIHIRNVIESGHVVVQYQPVVELATGAFVGAEALARIPGPDGAELSPAVFLPHLEALGMLPQLGALVIARACADFAARPQLGWVSVNLTSEDLSDPHLVDRLAASLERFSLPPERLVVEINERVVPETHVLRATRLVTEMGVRVALDDFGTGWSSLAQLRDLSLGLVKVDRSVVADATAETGGHVASMLAASVTMARLLGLEVIAEGIENERDSTAARAAGARYGQGFHWSAARGLDELVETWANNGAATRPRSGAPAGGSWRP